MPFLFKIDSGDLSAVLSRLAFLSYNESAVRERLGLEDLNDLQMKALPIYRQERLQARDPLASAINLFLLQGELPESDLDALFTPRDQAALSRAGLLERRGRAVQANASIYPVGQTLVFSDLAWPQLNIEGYSTVPYDQVMYVGTDSRWLARATVRKPIISSLDLCCGSGLHALLAATHARHAIAVDINPRAVCCTAFNAKALGLTNLEIHQGDLYKPLGDRRFDLITANPPFVPAPAQEVGFRDGGTSGEDIQRRIVEGLPRHLAFGGMAQMVTELGEREGESLEIRLRQWLGGAPMNIHVLRLRCNTAQAYAIGHADGEDYAALLDSVGRWAANLKAQGFDRIVSVLLAFQWSDAPWFRVDEAYPPKRDAGLEVEAIFEAERLSQEPNLKDKLKTARVARTGTAALLEARALGAQAPSTIRARLTGLAMPVEHLLNPLEEDLLCALENPAATLVLMMAAAKANIPEEAVMASLISLIRKGLVKIL
jgi:methylase of polypeptide subunit release factors